MDCVRTAPLPAGALPDAYVERSADIDCHVARKRGDLGLQFSALLPFHKLYSRVLLASAARRACGTPRAPR